MDYAADKQEHLAHLTRMAVIPGAKDQAWHRAKEMARDCPDLYGDIPQLLIEQVKRRANESGVE